MQYWFRKTTHKRQTLMKSWRNLRKKFETIILRSYLLYIVPSNKGKIIAVQHVKRVQRRKYWFSIKNL